MKGKREIHANTEGKQQIGNKQFVLLITAFLLGGQQIFIPVEETISHNQWLVTLGAAVIGLLLLGIYLSLSKLFPGKNLSQILTVVFGRVLGKILSFVYVVQFLLVTAFSLLLMANFWIGLDMWYTPQMVIMFFVMIAAICAAYLGIEVIARAAVVVVALLLTIAFLDTIFIVPEMKVSYLLPLQEIDGAAWIKSMKYVLLLEHFNLFMLVLPSTHTAEPSSLRKSVRPWVFWIFLYLILMDIRSALVLGPATYLYDYPSTHVLKVINLVEVVPQIELMGIMMLIACGILRIAYMFSVSLEMVNDTLAMREQRTLILPLALLVFGLAFCFVGFSGGIESKLDFYFSWFGVPFYVVIPVLLLLVGSYQTHKRKKQFQTEPIKQTAPIEPV